MSTLKARTDAKLVPFTLAHFTAWARTQPADQEYDFNDGRGGCAMGRYMRSHGREWNMNYFRSCEQVFGDPLDETLSACPHTFGALAQRLNATRHD